MGNRNMASEDVLRQADFHRNAMKALSMSQNNEVRRVAKAVLDTMSWLDTNFTDLQTLSGSVSQLESELEAANDKIRTLEIQLHNH